jgi:hypothetical protein
MDWGLAKERQAPPRNSIQNFAFVQNTIGPAYRNPNFMPFFSFALQLAFSI